MHYYKLTNNAEGPVNVRDMKLRLAKKGDAVTIDGLSYERSPDVKYLKKVGALVVDLIKSVKGKKEQGSGSLEKKVEQLAQAQEETNRLLRQLLQKEQRVVVTMPAGEERHAEDASAPLYIPSTQELGTENLHTVETEGEESIGSSVDSLVKARKRRRGNE